MSVTQQEPLVHAKGLCKSFGAVQALQGAELRIDRGLCIGVAGHNGAGKSTLMNILCGTLQPSAGSLHLDGRDIVQAGARWDVREARRVGIRRVFQELSLCDNLTLAENMHIASPLPGRRWRQQAAALLMAQLDRIFPGHALKANQLAGDLPIGKRQMVEIARAFVDADHPLRLMILDEPTSSLDQRSADQLLDHIRRFVAQGCSCILITHKLDEIFAVADRVVTMKDGRIVDDCLRTETDRSRLVSAMGQKEDLAQSREQRHAASTDARELVHIPATAGSAAMVVRSGEVIGLAGLAGHGQTALLVKLFRATQQRAASAHKVDCKLSFVAGDRQTDGIFPLWSIARNMSQAALSGLQRHGLLDPAKESALVDDWRVRLGLRTDDVNLPVLSLSGGNQQKVLFARALSADAGMVLMDDPMRGVDVGTKQDVYQLIRTEAAAGRSFVWYSTEFEELYHCDRVYVFNSGRIVGEIARADLTEERVVRMSFEVAAA